MTRDDGSDEGGFLGRWSRRKAAATRGEAPETIEPIAAENVAAQSGAAEGEAARSAPDGAEAAPEDEAALLERLGLPAPEALQADDSVVGFMRPEVPTALKQRALRRLWSLKPGLGGVDGLVDYGGDFTDAATSVGEVIASVYEAGDGYRRRFLEMEEAEAARAAEQAERDASSEAAEASEETTNCDEEALAESRVTEEGAPAVAERSEAMIDAAPTSLDEKAEAVAAAPRRSPRRMRFDASPDENSEI